MGLERTNAKGNYNLRPRKRVSGLQEKKEKKKIICNGGICQNDIHEDNGKLEHKTCSETQNGKERGGDDRSSGFDIESQDADYSYLPGLNDELALLCLVKASRREYGKLFLINKRYKALSESGDLYKIRRKMGIYEQWVFMLASGQFEWRAFDPKSGSWRALPPVPCDSCFAASDKESLCAGTHVLVFGREIEGQVIWRYELVTNKWFKGPSMITPRCLFASASCADFAFVAGGIGPNREILKSAEKYDPDKQVWEPLPDMHRARKLCSGCFMDNRFYVIGGTGEVGNLNCGEFYDFERKKWELISDMIPVSNSSSISQAPPLVAVVNNELYSLEASTNQLKFYIKQTNKWKALGQVPLRADCTSGWGVAFKSLGDQLLMIGGVKDPHQHTNGYGISIYSSYPEPNKPEANWHFVTRVGGSVGPFVFNCAIMST
ncbi:hypothetical protein SUGI_0838170 [Cryptomeria japonica]|uniref:F-box/kelch-repeat protein At3g27150 n=1 Tax=Cryptomeria japonica TaxID=3369 RepID=UPI0024149CCD|nr:F-box/kelch-repeat protein At3g27150 [Cryptomeria japonica]GLJ40608.1 hypothetical protein SUGI_0838170 [Cryptomeria japonica]